MPSGRLLELIMLCMKCSYGGSSLRVVLTTKIWCMQSPRFRCLLCFVNSVLTGTVFGMHSSSAHDRSFLTWPRAYVSGLLMLRSTDRQKFWQLVLLSLVPGCA